MDLLFKPTRREVVKLLTDRFVKKLEADAKAKHQLAAEQHQRVNALEKKRDGIIMKEGRKPFARRIAAIKKALGSEVSFYEHIDNIQDDKKYTGTFSLTLSAVVPQSPTLEAEISKIETEITEASKLYHELQKEEGAIQNRARQLSYCDDKSRADLLRLLLEKLPAKAAPLVDELIGMIEECSKTS